MASRIDVASAEGKMTFFVELAIIINATTPAACVMGAATRCTAGSEEGKQVQKALIDDSQTR